MIIELLKTNGYAVRETAKGHYMRGVIPLLGGQYRLNILHHEPLLRLFSNAQLRKGQAYTLKQMIQIAAPELETAMFIDHIRYLAAQDAFIRGYRLHCPMCDLDTWYAIDTLREMTACQGCRTLFQPPLELDFAYFPNRLLLQALKSGALTVLLTLYYWLQIAPITLWYAGLEVQKEGITSDIDLIVQSEQGLFMAECKDSLGMFTDPDALQRLIQQIEFGKSIAEIVGARYYFATLDQDESLSGFNHLREHIQPILISRGALVR